MALIATATALLLTRWGCIASPEEIAKNAKPAKQGGTTEPAKNRGDNQVTLTAPAFTPTPRAGLAAASPPPSPPSPPGALSTEEKPTSPRLSDNPFVRRDSMEATTAKTSTTATKASKTVWLGAPAAATSADRKDGAHTSLTKSSLASSSTSQGDTPRASKPKKSVYLAADPGEESCKPKMTQVAGLTDWNAGGTATSLCSTALTPIPTLTLTLTLALTLTRWHRH